MKKPKWFKPYDDPKLWWLDGSPIKGERLMRIWAGLDWGHAFIDPGPSPAGNQGPYWKMPFPAEDTLHRLYPRIPEKWLGLIQEAIEEMRR